MKTKNNNKQMEKEIDYSEYVCPSSDIIMEGLPVMQVLDSLSPSDRMMFIMYCEVGSCRAVAREIGVSHSKVTNDLKEIKKRLKTEIQKNIELYDIY